MNIKRYFAPDMRQAIRMVREEQGADAVILSNRKVEGGVEIVAARDFDEQLTADPDPAKTAAGGRPGDNRGEARKRAEDVFQETLGRIVPAEEAPAPPQPAVARSPAPVPNRAEPSAAIARLTGNATASRDPAAQRGSADAPRKISASRDKPAAPQQSQRPARPAAIAPTRSAAPAQEPGGQAAALRAALRGESANEPSRKSADSTDLIHLHAELRSMRRMLDSHFAETGWKCANERAPSRPELLRRLSAAGFSKRLAMSLAQQAGIHENLDTAQADIEDSLARQLPIAADRLLEYGGVAALVGPTGVGKTTTIAKLAARFRLKHGPRQVALITTDNYRIAAHEQLTTYGRILDVPVRVASSIDELRNLLAHFYDRRLVLIDTAGLGQHDRRLSEQAALFADAELGIKSYLVLSAASQLPVMREAIRAFSEFNPESCIFTKLDEAAQLGAAISALMEQQISAAYLCDGQQVPEDLHVAESRLLLERCFAANPYEEDSESFSRAEEDWVVHAHF